MPKLFSVVFYAAVAGVAGTAGGGLAASLIPAGRRRIIGFLMDYSAGLMLSVVCLTLLPSAFERAGLLWNLSGLFSGFVLMYGSDLLLRRAETRHGHAGLRTAGIAMAVGIAIHNFPEGIAIGSGFEADIRLGFSLAAAIAFHDVPEGASIALALRGGGVSKINAFAVSLLSGVPMVFGAVFGFYAGSLSASAISLCLSFAAGSMLYLIFGDMLPEAQKLGRSTLCAFGCSLGILSGMMLNSVLG